MSEPVQQLCNVKIVKLEILEENETPLVKDDVSTQQTIKMEDTLNTSEMDDSETMLKDLEPLNKPDQLDLNLEPAETSENEIKSHSTPDNDSHSKNELVYVHSMDHTKNDVGTEKTVDKRTDTPFESVSEKTDDLEQLILTNNPSEKIEESQSNADVNKQDNQIMSTEDNNKEPATISGTPIVGVLPPNPDDCGYKNNYSVNKTQPDKDSIETQVEAIRKENIGNISEKIDDSKLESTNTLEKPQESNSNTALIKDSCKSNKETEYSATHCNQDNQNMSTEEHGKESDTNVTISVTPAVGVLPPNPNDCDNKNNDSVNETQSDKDSIETRVEGIKKETIENISEKIDDSKLESTNTLEKPQESNSNTALIKDSLESKSNKETEYSATQCNQDNQNMSTEENVKESDTNATISVTPVVGVLPPNPNDCGNKNNDSVNETQSDKDSIETRVEGIKKENIENISEKIDDSKLESTNTLEKPQESNSNTALIKDSLESKSNKETEYSATQCNQDNQNMSTEENVKESDTNATISVSPVVGVLPPNPNDCGDKNNDHSNQQVENVVEIVSKPDESDDMYLQFKSEINAFDSSKHQSSNTASTSQNIISCANDNGAQNSSCTPNEVMRPLTQYNKWDFKRKLKIMIPCVFKLLGYKSKLKFDFAKNIIKNKIKLANMLPLTFNPEDKKKISECRSIYTSNWPTWITPQTIKLVLSLLTDIDVLDTECCIETLAYRDKKAMGAALISFNSADVCFQFFNQLWNICLFNKDVRVELDLDNKVRQTFTGVFIHSSMEDGSTCTITEDKWLTRSEKISTRFDRVLRRVTVTSKEAPPDYIPDVLPSFSRLKMNPTNDHERAELDVIHRLLGLQVLPNASFYETKRAFQNKIAPNIRAMPEPPFSETCTCIFVSNVPTWFELIHFLYLFELVTIIKWQTIPYYLEILQYSNGVNRGAALLRLQNWKICRKVFTELRGLCFLKKKKKDNIFITMDLYSKYQKQIGDSPPLNVSGAVATEFRSRFVRTNVDMPPTHKLDPRPVLSQKRRDQLEKSQSNSDENFAADINVPDHTISQGRSDIKTDIPENTDLKQIINENLMDIDFNEMAEDSVSNTNDNSLSGDADASSTQNNTENQRNNVMPTQASTSSLSKEPVKSCLVHLKLWPPGYKSHGFYQILSQTANFGLSTKYYGVRFLRDEHKGILNECLLKFDNPDDANIITRRLEGLTFKNFRVQAKLLQDSDLPSWGNDSCDISNPLKRKLDSGDDDQHESSTYKKSKFDEEWEVGYYARSHMHVSDSTEEKFGVNPFLLRKMNVKRFISPNIIVSNLHKDVSENKLREIFSLAGRVVTVTKKFRFSNYKAKIEYEHPLEALQAISMFHGQTLYGYEMNVAIHTEPKAKFLPIGLGGVGKGFGPNGVPLQCVHSHLEARKIYDILCRMGQVHQIVSKELPFAEYTPSVTHPKLSSMNNPFDLTTTKPNAETAIKALGTVLIALDIIPPETDTKDLRSIVNALQKHPKVAQADKQHNIQQQQTTNHDPNNKVEAFYQTYSGLMQQMEQQFPGWSGHSQTAPTNTSQNMLGLNLNNTGPSNIQPQTFPTEPYIRPEHSNHPLHTMPILSRPTKEYVPPGFWSANANAQSEPDGMSKMQNVPAGTEHINPIMQSFPAVTPNINPNMQNIPLGTLNISPGFWNINSYAQNELDGMANMQNVLPGTSHVNPNLQNFPAAISNINPNLQNFPAVTSNINPNMQSFAAVTPHINPYNMQNFPAGPSNTDPNYMQSAPDIFAGQSNMNANMQRTHSSMPNIDTNEQNHSKPGVDISMNPPVSGPVNTKMKHILADKNRHAREAPTPPRWGDPRIQEILASHNMKRQHPTGPRATTHTSKTTPKNQQSHNVQHTQELKSHPSRPHYDPRSDSKKDDTMSSGDDFESDLLQFKNLPSSVTAKALGRKMNEVGEIIFAEMTGKGKALVRFKRVHDAERCIRLFHHSKVDGHVIDVTPV